MNTSFPLEFLFQVSWRHPIKMGLFLKKFHPQPLFCFAVYFASPSSLISKWPQWKSKIRVTSFVLNILSFSHCGFNQVVVTRRTHNSSRFFPVESEWRGQAFSRARVSGSPVNCNRNTMLHSDISTSLFIFL